MLKKILNPSFILKSEIGMEYQILNIMSSKTSWAAVFFVFVKPL